MSAFAPWLLTLAFGAIALLCAHLASCATLILLYLELDALQRPQGPLQHLRPRWRAQRLMWRVLCGLGAFTALVLAGVAAGRW